MPTIFIRSDAGNGVRVGRFFLGEGGSGGQN